MPVPTRAEPPELHPIVEAAGKKVWKRFTLTVAGALLLWLFLHEHRNWVWAYFESVMTLNSPEPEQVAAAQAIASASISALTTAFIATATTLGAMILFFITGDTAAITSMFKFTSAASASGTLTAASTQAFENKLERKTEEKIEHVVTEGEPGAPERRPFAPDETQGEQP